eukprot:SAG11_NODE_1583_length_4644_cov_4.084708_2_plen_190_part_00
MALSVSRSSTGGVRRNDTLGFFDLVIKHYASGNVSKHLQTLTVGDMMEVKGCYTKKVRRRARCGPRALARATPTHSEKRRAGDHAEHVQGDRDDCWWDRHHPDAAGVAATPARPNRARPTGLPRRGHRVAAPQVAEELLDQVEDTTKITLLYCNQSPADVPAPPPPPPPPTHPPLFDAVGRGGTLLLIV